MSSQNTPPSTSSQRGAVCGWVNAETISMMPRSISQTPSTHSSARPAVSGEKTATPPARMLTTAVKIR